MNLMWLKTVFQNFKNKWNESKMLSRTHSLRTSFKKFLFLLLIWQPISWTPQFTSILSSKSSMLRIESFSNFSSELKFLLNNLIRSWTWKQVELSLQTTVQEVMKNDLKILIFRQDLQMQETRNSQHVVLKLENKLQF